MFEGIQDQADAARSSVVVDDLGSAIMWTGGIKAHGLERLNAYLRPIDRRRRLW